MSTLSQVPGSARNHRFKRAGFTRAETFVVLLILGLLTGLVLASSTTSRRNAQRIRCTNNLKEIGIAYRLWLTPDLSPSTTTSPPARPPIFGGPDSSNYVARQFRLFSDITAPQILT